MFNSLDFLLQILQIYYKQKRFKKRIYLNRRLQALPSKQTYSLGNWQFPSGFPISIRAWHAKIVAVINRPIRRFSGEIPIFSSRPYPFIIKEETGNENFQNVLSIFLISEVSSTFRSSILRHLPQSNQKPCGSFRRCISLNKMTGLLSCISSPKQLEIFSIFSTRKIINSSFVMRKGLLKAQIIGVFMSRIGPG